MKEDLVDVTPEEPCRTEVRTFTQLNICTAFVKLKICKYRLA